MRKVPLIPEKTRVWRDSTEQKSGKCGKCGWLALMWLALVSVTQRGAQQGGRKQMRANANKRRQMLTNASKRRAENASKREQTWTNANKRLHPLYCGFLHPPLQSPYVGDPQCKRFQVKNWPADDDAHSGITEAWSSGSLATGMWLRFLPQFAHFQQHIIVVLVAGPHSFASQRTPPYWLHYAHCAMVNLSGCV